MSNQLTIARAGGIQPRTAEQIAAAQARAAEVTGGISEGFGKVTYRGGKWGIKYKGQSTPLMRYTRNAAGQLIFDGAEPFLDCVLLEAAERTSKIFYLSGYTEGTSQPPDCWSSNGMQPDAGAPRKQSPTCPGCPKNAWGSAPPKQDGTPSRGKACADHKRMAVVPVKDIKNEAFGGPLLLQVPPSSLKNYAEYIKNLADLGYHMHEVWTRIAFDPQSTYPLMVFDAVAVLVPDQMAQVQVVLDDPMIDRILNTEIVGSEGYDDPDQSVVTSEGNAQPTVQAQATSQPAPQTTIPPATFPVQAQQPNGPPPGLSPEEWAAIQAQRQAATAPPPPPPPPGISPEEWAAIQALRAKGAGQAIVTPDETAQTVETAASTATGRRGRRARTATPTPQPHDSAAAEPSAATGPQPVAPTNPAPPNGAGQNTAVADISAMVDKLL